MSPICYDLYDLIVIALSLYDGIRALIASYMGGDHYSVIQLHTSQSVMADGDSLGTFVVNDVSVTVA